MTRPPTAEEVLGLYQQFRKWMLAGNSNTANAIELNEAFVEAFEQWQAAQGPVTREWFVERFGGTSWDNGNVGLVWLHSGKVTLGCRMDGEQWYYIPITSPTRSDIETLVRVLGGENHGKEA